MEEEEPKSQRPDFDFEAIQAKEMNMLCTKPPPGIKDEYPIKAFIDFDSVARRTWFKN
jgi:hypothetical protein